MEHKHIGHILHSFLMEHKHVCHTLHWFTTRGKGTASEHAQESISLEPPPVLPSALDHQCHEAEQISLMLNTIDKQGIFCFKVIVIPWGLKLKSGGRKRPFGRRVFGSRSSSKKECVKASNCIGRKQIMLLDKPSLHPICNWNKEVILSSFVMFHPNHQHGAKENQEMCLSAWSFIYQ